jgi:putative ABC transport system ATP-binding protein
MTKGYSLSFAKPFFAFNLLFFPFVAIDLAYGPVLRFYIVFMPLSPVLRIRQLSKFYGKEQILRGVSLDLFPSESVAVMGPSGAGKSTLLNCLTGVESADSGSIVLDDLDLARADEAVWSRIRRERFGYVFQFFHLLPTMNVSENIEFPLLLLNQKPNHRRERVQQMLQAVGLEHRAKAFPNTLSGGERQRVALARAIVHEPSILFADEPTGSLDSKNGAEAMQLLQQLCADFQVAMLMVTHDPDAAAQCQRQLSMRDGELLSERG